MATQGRISYPVRTGAFLLLAALALHSAAVSRKAGRGVERARIYIPAQPAISSRYASPEGLRRLMDAARSELPRKSEGRALARARLLDAANELGLIAEAAELNPALAGDAARFFKTCALDPQIQDAFRAVCYRQLSAISSNQGRQAGVSASSLSMSPEIRRIVRRL